MAGTQQPPSGNWQLAQPGGQPPQPGIQFPTAGFVPARAKPRRRLRGWIIAAAVVVVAAAGFVGEQQLTAKPKGSVVLPQILLGQPRVTSAAAERVAHTIMKKESSGASGTLLSVVAGIYGQPTGAWFAISGGGLCGTCSAKSAGDVKANLVSAGFSDANVFPAGAKGGVLVCGSRAVQGATSIRCTWVDGTTGGDVLYEGGSATGLADAAAKTNQVRAGVER